MSTDIFCVQSPLHYTVACSKDQFTGHICINHEMMDNNIDAIKQAIEKPSCIYESSDSPKRDVYFGKSTDATYGDKYFTKVIVEVTNNIGDVVTAFPTPTICGGINKENVKYEKPNTD